MVYPEYLNTILNILSLFLGVDTKLSLKGYGDNEHLVIVYYAFNFSIFPNNYTLNSVLADRVIRLI